VLGGLTIWLSRRAGAGNHLSSQSTPKRIEQLKSAGISQVGFLRWICGAFPYRTGGPARTASPVVCFHTIEDYRQGLVPLTLLKHYLDRYPVPEWVHQQVYLLRRVLAPSAAAGRVHRAGRRRPDSSRQSKGQWRR
jgi:hypothetical protein